MMRKQQVHTKLPFQEMYTILLLNNEKPTVDESHNMALTDESLYFIKLNLYAFKNSPTSPLR